jgi:hypothetical protein
MSGSAATITDLPRTISNLQQERRNASLIMPQPITAEAELRRRELSVIKLGSVITDRRPRHIAAGIRDHALEHDHGRAAARTRLPAR